ncbi:hypothetical protein ARMGADRAFT_1031529 [Armillaria gallica]|uniref:Uncharacterized protein n=1 Tax=Armillaria gallica TaxID=47427 RepID=A0A2H3DQE2_ARMGA|nr:hypothetical protein ARMGADRAFT_1031529 [Armillaria gallica]
MSTASGQYSYAKQFHKNIKEWYGYCGLGLVLYCQKEEDDILELILQHILLWSLMVMTGCCPGSFFITSYYPNEWLKFLDGYMIQPYVTTFMIRGFLDYATLDELLNGDNLIIKWKLKFGDTLVFCGGRPGGHIIVDLARYLRVLFCIAFAGILLHYCTSYLVARWPKAQETTYNNAPALHCSANIKNVFLFRVRKYIAEHMKNSSTD